MKADFCTLITKDIKNQILQCFVEKGRRRHFERAVGESRNLLSSRFLRFASLRDASVEMTVGVFYRAISKYKIKEVISKGLHNFDF
jgi:hypothetical protein